MGTHQLPPGVQPLHIGVVEPEDGIERCTGCVGHVPVGGRVRLIFSRWSQTTTLHVKPAVQRVLEGCARSDEVVVPEIPAREKKPNREKQD